MEQNEALKWKGNGEKRRKGMIHDVTICEAIFRFSLLKFSNENWVEDESRILRDSLRGKVEIFRLSSSAICCRQNFFLGTTWRKLEREIERCLPWQKLCAFEEAIKDSKGK